MNRDITDGAQQLMRGLKTEAKGITSKIVSKFDANNDGKVDFAELKKEIVGEARDGVDKLKALTADEELSQKTKDEINKAIDKIKPMIEAAKMDVEIKKEKIMAEIEHRKQVEEIKVDVEEASSFISEAACTNESEAACEEMPEE